MERDRGWFKSAIGSRVQQTPREESFSSWAILSREVLVVSDASKDERFRDSEIITGPMNSSCSDSWIKVSRSRRLSVINFRSRAWK
jgi:hypothetical protein